jgi:hypothetical protein
MNILFNHIECKHSELEDTVLPLLIDTVFHVTNEKGFKGIMSDGFIRNNKDDIFEYSFSQSKNSYGRKKGYICLFDFRNKSEDIIQNALLKYYFLHPFHDENRTYFFQISAVTYPNLIDVTEAKREIGYSRVWIPKVECWFPHDFSIEYIEKVIDVRIINMP